MKPATTFPARQRGIVLVLFAIGMVAILGVAGLALDLGHAYLNKTRLQNALDAAVLSAAKTLSDGDDVAAAGASGCATFAQQLDSEMAEAQLDPVVEFSATLNPFVAGAVAPDARYVRFSVASFPMTVWLARVLPGVGDTFAVGGSAVAGPGPPLDSPGSTVCDIAPLVMCADTDLATGLYDTDCSDDRCYGYNVGEEEIVLKTGAGSGKGGTWDIGAGNYRLIQLECGAGGNCVRDNLAGEYSGCLTNGGSVTTKPGNTVGPVAQGFNTRFGIYQGGMSSVDYPPDAVTHSAAGFWYDDYLARLDHGPYDFPIAPDGSGVPMRRVLAVPMGNCTGTINGQGPVPVVGLGCFFMTRPAQQGGQQQIYGQLVSECRASGNAAVNPGAGGLVHEIVLYKDPDSQES